MDETTTFAFSIVTLEALTPQIKAGAIILMFIAFDIITGLLKAFATQSYESSVMRQGLYHKLGEILAFIFGVACDILFPYIGVKIPVSLAGAICVYVAFMEVGSVVENIAAINPDLAKYLHKVFAKIEKPPDDENDDNGVISNDE